MTDMTPVILIFAFYVVLLVFVLRIKGNDEPEFDAETIKALKEKKPCDHCGGIHAIACPRVKRMRFESGKLAEVEFWETWSSEGVIWPEEVLEAEARREAKKQ